MSATWLLTLGCGLIASRFHHQVGIAPLLGAILCAGIFLRSRDLWLVGLGGMLVRDLLLGFSLFTLVRLVAISLVVATVQWLKIQPNLRSLLTGLLVSSPLFHLALAVGNWATNACGVWPKSPAGLWHSMASSVPYFQSAFVGDLLFANLFLAFYVLAGYAVSGRWVKALIGSRR